MTQRTDLTLGIQQMPAAEYHALDRVSSSILRARLSGLMPGHIRHDGEEPEDGSADLDVGTAAHTAVLQPEQWDHRVVRALDIDRRSNENKRRWGEFELAHAGKVQLKPEDYELAKTCAARLLAHPMVKFDLSSGAPELVVLWDEPVGPYLLPCKAMCDWYNEQERILVDLKTTRHRGYRAIEREIVDRRYHVQLAWYRHALRTCGKAVQHCCLAVVEKAPPHGVAHYEIPDVMLDAAWRSITPELDFFSLCYQRREWPLYSDENMLFDPPAWMIASA